MFGVCPCANLSSTITDKYEDILPVVGNAVCCTLVLLHHRTACAHDVVICWHVYKSAMSADVDHSILQLYKHSL